MKAVSKTAYYCGGVRMQDAESAKPLIGDKYARRLLGQDGIIYWQNFKHFTAPNASNTARHYIIDQNVKQLLEEQPDTTIVLIGAGLDSRAYRFTTGNWVEIDEAAMISYKNNVLPVAECPNRLERIAINFETEKLEHKLLPYVNDSNVIFIIEGVLMYLTDEQKETILKTLTTMFSKHVVFCDLMKKNFFEKYSKPIHEKLVENGTTFADLAQEPAELFLRYGYQQKEVVSTLKKSIELGLLRIPKFIVNLFFKNNMMGYSVYTFVYDAR